MELLAKIIGTGWALGWFFAFITAWVNGADARHNVGGLMGALLAGVIMGITPVVIAVLVWNFIGK